MHAGNQELSCESPPLHSRHSKSKKKNGIQDENRVVENIKKIEARKVQMNFIQLGG